MKKKNEYRFELLLLVALMFIIVITANNSHANTYALSSTDSLNIIKLKQYERTKLRAEKHYRDLSFAKGIEVYKKALNILPSDDTIKLQIANGYYHVNNLDRSYSWYQLVIEEDSVITDEIHYLNYAEILTSRGQYEEARKWYGLFEKHNPTDSRVKERLKGLDKIVSYYKDSARFEIANAPFNSSTYDFSPSYHEDELLFVSARETHGAAQFLKPKYKWDKTYFLNLYTVNDDNEVAVFDKRIKSSYHEGPVAFYENDTRVLFTRNNFTKGELRINNKKINIQGAKVSESKEGVNKLKLFFSEKDKNGDWTTPVAIWFNSDEYSTGHPTVSKDGQRLYFTSDRPGGYGHTDIYQSIWRNGVWGEPENMGDIINTEGTEMFPYIDENGILYYSTDGLEGLGGLDIFSINLNDPNATPQNMGYPLNSSTDDFGIISRDNGTNQTGYFASNRVGGLGLDDVYSFSYEKRRSIPGKVVDIQTGELLSDVEVMTKDRSGEITNQITTNANGMFFFQYDWAEQYQACASKPGYSKDLVSFDPADLPVGDTLILKIMKEALVIKGTVSDKVKGDALEVVKIIVTNKTTGDRFGMITKADGRYSFIGQPNTVYSFMMKKHRYFSGTNHLTTGEENSGEIVHDGELEEIIIGKPIELDDIHFDLAKWNIRPDAAIELDKFVQQLNENPSIIVELSTHTDSRGSDAYNLNLSDQRAKSSADYAISHGITENRIEGQGYGETKHVNKCDNGVRCSEEEHQRNRRAEFKVTGFLPEMISEEEKALLWINPDYLSNNMSNKDKSKIVMVNESHDGQIVITGQVIDDTGQPVSDAFLSINEQGNRQKVTQEYADNKGRFELKVQPNKTYQIAIQREGYTREGIEVEVKTQSKQNLNIELVRLGE